MYWPKPGSAMAAAWFGAILCLFMLLSSFDLAAKSYGFIPFFSFLPVVFFQIALNHQKAEKTIRELRERVEVLEAGAAPREEP